MAACAEPYAYILRPFKLEEIQTSIEMALYRDITDRRSLE